MENLKSKRRPILQQDEVDAAIERMGKRWRYNPVRRHWWKWLVMVFIFFVLWSLFGPAWATGGAFGVGQLIANLALSLAINATFAIFFIWIQFFAIARPRTYWLKPGETGISFADYKGNQQVLDMAREVVLLLKGVKDFKNMGGELIRGLLLEGDPGTGKSYLAQAIATEAGLPFGYCSAASLQSPFLAGGVMSVKSLYKKARKFADQYGACILFLDELDAIGQSRQGMNQQMGMSMGGMMGGGGGILNELLVQLDPPPVNDTWQKKFLQWLGFPTKKKAAIRANVLTIGATNVVDTLDPALLRPGRFDRKIKVEQPDADGRREIIEYYLDKVNHENIPVDRLVAETIGYTPVAIRYVINEAVVRAHFDGRDAITYQDLIRARDLHEVGLRQPIRSMSKEEKRRIAYHEVGHAVAQALLVPHENIVKVTIIRHGGALGYMQPKPKEERYTLLKEEIEADIQVSLASRAAEEIFLNTMMTGFSGDLASATQRAVMYCSYVGMNGHLSSAAIFGVDPSIKPEVEAFLETQYKKVKALLQANQEMCHALAEALLEREELFGDEVMEIINSFTPVYTSDAKNIRQMGFRPNKERKEGRVGGTYTAPVSSGVIVDGTASGTNNEDDGLIYPPAVAGFSQTNLTGKNNRVIEGELARPDDDYLPRSW
jgi:ATP-dependent Zn protease